ncbi:hypothetical protein [Paraburkholderia franconis]|uniref:hypothetical protein n=1 Tax=Paraburkholderia franconis TaxID=2654983 RepID=UPI001D106DED|nr:hypothetical protein [Paraburkholderia franconis]
MLAEMRGDQFAKTPDLAAAAIGDSARCRHRRRIAQPCYLHEKCNHQRHAGRNMTARIAAVFLFEQREEPQQRVVAR